MDKPAEVVAIRHQAEFIISAAVVDEGTCAESHVIAKTVLDGWGNIA